ncbi:MAG TPA: helix-turn-helix transcriptional regulator, partial [Spirochaetota bacterium]|nr:helix-turn-helix transcriptional regulator [Spirochaetota bacterium]
LIFVYFIVKIIRIKNKEASHWVFLCVCFLFLLRIVSINLVIVPVLEKNNVLGMTLYRVQIISVIFLPAFFAHFFYLLLGENNKKNLIIILCIYFLSLFFYIMGLIGANPITKELKVDNDKIRFVIDVSSYFYKTVIILFVFTYFFSIRLLSKFSNIKMTNKDKKTIDIMKWTYIFTFGYGYIFQFFISFINPDFYSLTPYLITIFSVVIYRVVKRYNFLKIYKTSQFLNLINEDFTLPFIITDEKGTIIKTNFKNMDNNIFFGKSIFSVFSGSLEDIVSTLENGAIIKNINLTFSNNQNHIEISYTVDVNPIKDKFQDIIGLFILLSGYKVSLNSFSERERDIIDRLTKGASYKEIAYELNISYNTVNTHVKNIYKKSGVGERKELLESLKLIG